MWAVDLPGQPGLSSAAVVPVEDHAGWLADVVAAARAERPDGRLVLAGVSRGAAIALHAEPDAVDGLVLVSPGGLVPVRMRPAVLATSLAWTMFKSARASRALIARMSAPGQEPLADHVDWLTLVARSCRLTLAPGVQGAPILERWRGRQVRLLLGDRDEFFPVPRMRTAARRALGIDPIVVPGHGHFLVYTNPSSLLDAIHA